MFSQLQNMPYQTFILTVSTIGGELEVEDGVLEQTSSNINKILKENEQSNEECHRKVSEEINKLSKAIEDIKLSKEELGKLSIPLSQWSEDLKKRMEDLHFKSEDLTPEKVIQTIDESIASRPELTREVGNLLKRKDESKVERFFARLRSATKHLGHKIAEKFRSGWKIAKKFFKKTQRALVRVGYVALGLFEIFILNPVMILGTYLFGDDENYSDTLTKALVEASVMRIYDAIFKFHGDADYTEKMLSHNEKIFEPVEIY
ncbi:uncharacterized protein LOC141852489 isoform X2 [Brevipalpus obovatus]|uniref:uncharacterized protein LOC141852489 isoform X2 n=1 Tax=Brevipalpus obovatus TaxID=246614 RepID=UPI003D9F9F56